MKTFKQVREELKAVIEAIPALSGVPVLLEHDGEIDGAVEDALAVQGIALVVWMAAGGSADSVRSGGAVLRVQLPVSIIENPAVNMGATGKRLPTEAALQALLEGAIGRPCGDGTLALGQEVFARADADAGELETVAGFDAALIVRPR